MRKSKPLFSIITVCYNSEKNIPITIDSVLNQSFQNFEYIIIDGKSTDGTLEIVKGYIPKFKGRMKLISEKDKGISDSFNKGLNISRGDWIYFLNSGDFLFSQNTLSKIATKTSIYDIITGPVKLVGKESYFPKNPKRSFLFGLPAHQGTFIKSRFAKEIRFNLRFKIRMDYDYFLRLNKKFPNLKICSFNEFIAYYELGGISDKKIFLSEIEGIYISIINKHFFPLGGSLLRGMIRYLRKKLTKFEI